MRFVALALVAMVIGAGPETRPAPQPENAGFGGVAGSAWLVKEDGTSSLFRGLHVVVVPRESRDLTSILAFVDDQKGGFVEHAVACENEVARVEKIYPELADSPSLEKTRQEARASREIAAAISKITIGLREKKEMDRLDELKVEKDLYGGVPQEGRRGGPRVDKSGDAVASGKTDADGKYTLDHVRTGEYYLIAEFQSQLLSMDWIVPINVRQGETVKIDLYNDNASYISNR